MKNIILEKPSYMLLVLGFNRVGCRGLQMVVLRDEFPDRPLEDRAGIRSTRYNLNTMRTGLWLSSAGYLLT